jgi:hypothetical protein
MVTILPKDENSWGDIGERFASGLTQGYTNTADELAIRKAIEDLGPNAKAKDVLNAVANTRPYNPESKKKFTDNFLKSHGIDLEEKKFAEMKRQTEAKEAAVTKKNEILENTNKLKGELKALEEEKKAKKDMNDALSLVDHSGLDHEAKDVLREKIRNGETSYEAVKEIFKAEKGQEKNKAEEKSQQTTQKALNNIAELIPKVGRSNIAESYLGGDVSHDFAKFTSLTGALEALLVEKVNRGALAKERFNYITKTLLPQPSDTQAEIRGKLEGIAAVLDLDPEALGLNQKGSGKEQKKDAKGRPPFSAFEVED